MLVRKCRVAELALEPVSSHMHSQVLRQVCLLRETLIAAWLLTDKWSLASVNPQVIEEVVPFAKEHPAMLVVTLQNLDLSHCPRIFVLKDTKSAR